MGLSASRKRAKISHDPNNTAWSRSTTKFGQRILESQGWTPGAFLGAKNAPHAKHHTAANVSHIRVAPRDDNLGLGAKPGLSRQDGQTTGLDMFQDLLGRLNGKSEVQITKEQKARIQLRGSSFIEQRWGRLRFVSGGLLLGDELEVLPRKDNSVNIPQEEPIDVPETAVLTATTEYEKACSGTVKRKIHRRSKGDTGARESAPEELSGTKCYGIQSPPRDRDRTLFKRDKGQRRAEKAAGKLRRKIKRDNKHALQLEEPAAQGGRPLVGAVDPEPLSHVGDAEASPTCSGDIPVTKAKARPVFGGGRQAVRRRYIEQKKLSLMDSKALNEVMQ